MYEGANQYRPTQKSAEGKGETRDELAKAAGVSHDTIAKVEKIEAKATPGRVVISKWFWHIERWGLKREKSRIWKVKSG